MVDFAIKLDNVVGKLDHPMVDVAIKLDNVRHNYANKDLKLTREHSQNLFFFLTYHMFSAHCENQA